MTTNEIQMSKSKCQIKSKIQMTNVYDLKKRTAEFGKRVILMSKIISLDSINRPLISQIIRSGTSIGANYMEADGAESKKDFRHKIALCKKESKETMHWLEMIAAANKERSQELRVLWQEAHELTLIFSSTLNSSKK